MTLSSLPLFYARSALGVTSLWLIGAVSAILAMVVALSFIPAPLRPCSITMRHCRFAPKQEILVPRPRHGVPAVRLRVADASRIRRADRSVTGFLGTTPDHAQRNLWPRHTRCSGWR